MSKFVFLHASAVMTLLHSGCGQHPAASNSAASLDDGETADIVADILKTQQFRSITGVIESLPTELHENFALVRNSRSLQGSSPEYPRVVMYSKDGRIFVTFNGTSEHRGFQSVEWIFRARDKTGYEFQSLNFDTGTPAGKLSEINPPLCQNCHGKDNRPIWNTKPDFFDLFGSGMAWSEDESDYVNTMQKSKWGMHARYSLLNWQNYAVPGRKTPGNIVDEVLEDAQIRIISKWIRETESFQMWQFLIRGVLLNCENLMDFVPADIQPSPKLLHDISEDTKKWLPRMSVKQQSTQTSEVQSVINYLRWVFEGREIDMRIWSRTVGHPYLHTGSGLNFYRKIGTQLNGGDSEPSCAELKLQSLRAFQERN